MNGRAGAPIATLSLAGAIVSNTLFMLGVSFLLGGLKYHEQEFNRSSARMQASLLFLATLALLVPTAVGDADRSNSLFMQQLSVGLSVLLMVDPRVPATERILVTGAVLYALIPCDFIPDVLPFVGQVDDAYLVAISLLRLMTVTDPRVVREHWRGGGDVV